MAKPNSSSEVIPGTIFTPRQVSMLKWAVLVMGIILVAGFALVMGAIVYQASNLNESTPAPITTSSSEVIRALSLPEGMSVSHIALDDNRLAIHLTGPGASEIRVIDLGTGQVIRRIPLSSE